MLPAAWSGQWVSNAGGQLLATLAGTPWIITRYRFPGTPGIACARHRLANNLGSFVTLAAIRGALSLLSSLAARLVFKINVGKLLPVVIAHDEVGFLFCDHPRDMDRVFLL